MPGLDAPDPSTVARLHAYSSVWRLRADAWTSLADVTKRLADTLTPTDLRPGLQARTTELVLLPGVPASPSAVCCWAWWTIRSLRCMRGSSCPPGMV
jgi:hypothetical protein